MPHQPKVNTETLKFLYTVQHLTCDEIGKLVGMSRVGVWKRLQSIGVKSSDGEWVRESCNYCGEFFEVGRSRWRKHRKHYCCEDHYFADLHNPEYHYHRHAMRLARKVVSQYFKLQDGNIVHHHDGNNDNNEISNLAVFKNHAEHMKHHRGSGAEPLWDGRTLS